jgi:hypothetical protein
MKTEFICTLHSKEECCDRRYDNRICELKPVRGFAVATCQYRMEAITVTPLAAELVESPGNITQQINGGSDASTQTAEASLGITDIF